MLPSLGLNHQLQEGTDHKLALNRSRLPKKTKESFQEAEEVNWKLHGTAEQPQHGAKEPLSVLRQGPAAAPLLKGAS